MNTGAKSPCVSSRNREETFWIGLLKTIYCMKEIARNKMASCIYFMNVPIILIWWALFVVGWFSYWNFYLLTLVAACVAHVFVYIKFRKNSYISVVHAWTGILLVLYIFLAENIGFIDNAFDLGIYTKLDLSPRLMDTREARQQNSKKNQYYLRQDGQDPLFYNSVPGTKNGDRITDETGYHNQPGFYNKTKQIDIFVSGDSVLEGANVEKPWIDFVRESLSCTIYDLSAGSYSTLQKATALLKYGLPKKPKILILEFNAANDLSEMVEYFAGMEMGYKYYHLNNRGLMLHSFLALEKDLVETSGRADSGRLFSVDATRRVTFISNLRRQSLTFSVTHYIISKLRDMLAKSGIVERAYTYSATNVQGVNINNGEEFLMPLPASPHYHVEDFGVWLGSGSQFALNSLESFLLHLSQYNYDGKVVILYTPSIYEVYRGVAIREIKEVDEVVAWQKEGLRSHLAGIDIELFDLTPAFRDYIQVHRENIYDYTDLIHWNQVGHKIAGQTIAKKLLPYCGN